MSSGCPCYSSVDDTSQCFSGSTINQVFSFQGIHDVHSVHRVHGVHGAVGVQGVHDAVGVHGVHGAGGVHGVVVGGDRQQAEAISCTTVPMPVSTFYLHTTPTLQLQNVNGVFKVGDYSVYNGTKHRQRWMVLQAQCKKIK